MNQVVRPLGAASFNEMVAVLNEFVAAQSLMLRQVALHAVHLEDVPAIDVAAMRERVGILAQVAQLIAALQPEEDEVRKLAARRAEWLTLLEGVNAEIAASEPPRGDALDICRESFDSEFEAIAQALRDAARAERNNLPGLRRQAGEIGTPQAVAALQLVIARAGRVQFAATVFEELIPKEHEVRALMPGAPIAASIQPEVP